MIYDTSIFLIFFFVGAHQDSILMKTYPIFSTWPLSLNFMAPFYGWGSTASRLEPLGGGSLLFTTKFLEIPGTHLIDLRRIQFKALRVV